MVKIQCCDVCYYVEHKVKESKVNYGFKGSGIERVHVCNEHKPLFEKCNMTEYKQMLSDIYAGKMPVRSGKIN